MVPIQTAPLFPAQKTPSRAVISPVVVPPSVPGAPSTFGATAHFHSALCVRKTWRSQSFSPAVPSRAVDRLWRPSNSPALFGEVPARPDSPPSGDPAGRRSRAPGRPHNSEPHEINSHVDSTLPTLRCPRLFAAPNANSQYQHRDSVVAAPAPSSEGARCPRKVPQAAKTNRDGIEEESEKNRVFLRSPLGAFAGNFATQSQRRRAFSRDFAGLAVCCLAGTVEASLPPLWTAGELFRVALGNPLRAGAVRQTGVIRGTIRPQGGWSRRRGWCA